MVGDIELRGRLPASTPLAAGRPSSVGAKLKSVSLLLSRKPDFVIKRAPKPSSMVVVIERAFRLASTIEIWLVPFSIPSEGAKRNAFLRGGSPALARPIDLSGETSPARLFR